MNSLVIGTILHGKSYNYKIEKFLGQGTFGITYLASVKIKGDLGTIDSEVFVAIKEFFMKDINGRNERSVTYSNKDGAFAYYKEKFIHEAKILSNLHNPGIIKVLELFEENQTAYYVMEYISQGSLDNKINIKGRLTSRESVSYTLQIAKALSYMHQNKMLHLDLKPNNIMIRKDNKIVLIDFGLTKRFDDYGNPDTSTRIGHGTPGYSPVEQANYKGSNSGEFPATLDVYALGGTMFKMLTGNRPPEASVILNEGFPISEFEDLGVDKQMVDIVARCMAPLRKNRYKNASEVIDALSKLDLTSEEDTNIPKCYYKIKTGELEYGTFKIERVPVTNSFEFPEYINFKLWDNSRQGKSYEVIMTNGHSKDGYSSLIRIWDKGVIIDEHQFQNGIPNDVKDYLISHGFLSTEHWENECITTPINDDFGTDASITMIQCDGRKFVRRVNHAHTSYHNLLLDQLVELLNTTSLAKELELDKNKLIQTKRLVIPLDTFEFSVNFEPSQIGSKKREGGFGYFITTNSIGKYNKGNILLDSSTFNSLLAEIEGLGIQTGAYKKDTHDYSEIPGKIDIKFNSRGKGLVHLSLIAFNNDMQGGNIYESNIIDLANSIHRIVIKYLSDNHEPTRELIYTIPESTSEIWIDYSEGGIASHHPKSINFKIVNNKKREGIYSPEEVNKIIKGLKDLKLRSQDEIDVEPSTGIVFPKLILTLVDSDGNLLKQFYAQDNGDKMIGNIVITVEELKDELSLISDSFRNLLVDNEKNKSRESLSSVVFRFIFLSVVIGIIALPTFLFVKPEDDLFNWLWLTIGIAEFFSVFLFSVGGRFNPTSSLSNFETISFIIGILSIIAYVILWIFQMCYWWA